MRSFSPGAVATIALWKSAPMLRLSLCVSVCFPHNISKADAARIAKLDREMFHDESWKPIYFGSKGKRSRSRVIETLGLPAYRYMHSGKC